MNYFNSFPRVGIPYHFKSDKMFASIVSRIIATLSLRQDFILPRWMPPTIQPLREIVIHSKNQSYVIRLTN